MPVYPVAFVPVVKTGAYPHMAKLDAAIWERFLDQYGANFLGVAYDVALGGYLPGESEGPLDVRLGWQYSTALKVDAVLQREAEVWIVEVKPNGRTSGIGAALCYTALAEADPFTTFPLVPVYVTDRASPDIRLCAEKLGVTLVAVDEPLNPDLDVAEDDGVDVEDDETDAAEIGAKGNGRA